jgi:DNA repair exonuclease SbcCD nuclease subunit
VFEFIHAGDLHLDSPLRGLERYEGAPLEEIRLASRRAFSNLVELAIARRVAFVVLSGDIFDGDWKDYNTGLFFAREMARLKDKEIKVYLLKGNHDAANKISKALKMPENVFTFGHNKPETFLLPELEVALHGQSFASQAVVKNIALDYPDSKKGYFNIGVLHTSLSGVQGHEPYAPCTVGDLLSKNYDYWALGHVHKRDTLNQKPPVIFPGNIQGRHIKETGPKGCALVSVNERHECQVSFEDLSVLRWESCLVDFSEISTMEDALSLVERELNKLLEDYPTLPLAVRLELTGATAVNTTLRSKREHWINQIRALATEHSRERIWIEKVKFNTETPSLDYSLSHLEGPLSEIEELKKELKANPENLQVLIEEFSALEKKLPPEVKENLNLLDCQYLQELLDDAQELLLDHLNIK